MGNTLPGAGLGVLGFLYTYVCLTALYCTHLVFA